MVHKGKKFFSLEKLNSAIQCFGYGFINAKNKPSILQKDVLLGSAKLKEQGDTACMQGYIFLRNMFK